MIINITTFGAAPNSPDNTDAIQRALDIAVAGDTIYVPVGIFVVDAVRSLLVRSSTTLQIDGGLQALPGPPDKPNVVVSLNGVSNVTVSGSGYLIGERAAHAPGNKAGFCLAITGSSNVTVKGGLTLRDAWADGIYVQDSTNVVIDNVICTNNSRNGMSIISAQTMTVNNSLFTLTNSESPMPQAGIDIEPDVATESLLDISISGNRFVKNKGPGCYIAFAPAANRARVFVVNNVYDQHYKDGSGPCIGGEDTALSNFLYAVCRWIPGYDYWGYPSQFTLS